MFAIIRRAALSALVLSAAACDRGALEPAAPLAPAALVASPALASEEWDDEREHPLFHRVEESEHSLDRLLTFGCGPLDEGSTELVRVEGVARRRDISMNLPDGSSRWIVKVQPTMIPGVGLRTGHAYVVSTQGGDFYVSGDGSGGTLRDVWRMRNLVTGEQYAFTYLVRWAFDENGTLVEHREEEKVRCVKE